MFCTNAICLLLLVTFVCSQNETLNCISECREECTCPTGANGYVCSKHGTCVSGECSCNDNWLNSEDRKACDIAAYELTGIAYYFVAALTTACIGTALLTSTIYYFYRHDTIMLYFRPSFGHLMNVGAILGSVALLYAAHVRRSSYHCVAVWWLLDYSYVFVFGTLMAKTYRNYRILKNTRNESLRLSDGWILRVIFALILIETTILVILLVLGEFEIHNGFKQWSRGDGTFEQFQGCYIDSFLALVLLVPSKLITIFVIFVLACQLRKLRSEYNESNPIFFSSGIALFIWSFSLFIYLISSFSYGDMFYGSLALSICIPFIVIILTLCIPKVLTIHYQSRKRARSRGETSFSGNMNGRRTSCSADVADRSRLQSMPVSLVSISGHIDINEYLRNVVWSDVGQVELAERMIESCTSPINTVADFQMDVVFLLLSRQVRHRRIRKFAADSIQLLSDNLLLLYCPQFLEALKFEPQLVAASNRDSRRESPSDIYVGTSFDLGEWSSQNGEECPMSLISPLADVLSNRSANSYAIAHAIYWRLQVELLSQEVAMVINHGVPSRVKRDRRSNKLYQYFSTYFVANLQRESSNSIYSMLENQNKLLQNVGKAYEIVMSNHGDVKTKTAYLQKALVEKGDLAFLFQLEDQIPHPLHTDLMVDGIVPAACGIFRSSAKPMKLEFRLNHEAQRKRIQHALASGLQDQLGSAKVMSLTRNISLSFDANDGILESSENARAFSIIVRIHKGRNLRVSTSKAVLEGEFFIRIDLGGKMKKTEIVGGINPCWDSKFEFSTGTQPHDMEAQLFFIEDHEKRRRSAPPSEKISNDLPDLTIGSVSTSDVIEKQKPHYIGEFSLNFDLLVLSEKYRAWHEFKRKSGINEFSEFLPPIIISGEVEIEVIISPLASGTTTMARTMEEGINRSIEANVKKLASLANPNVIYKEGDDLRQDDLAIQMISIMNSLLVEGGLDLCITVYKVLAVSPTKVSIHLKCVYIFNVLLRVLWNSFRILLQCRLS